MVHQADVVIIGGGPIGCLAALELASHRISSLILDQAEPQAIANPMLEGRTIALSYASVSLLQRLDLWRMIVDQASPIKNIVVSNGVEGQMLHYGQKESDGHTLGYNVDLTAFKRVLLNGVQSTPGIQFFAPFKVNHLNCSSYDVTVEDDQGTQMKGLMCLAADGKNSPTRSRLYLPAKEWTYHQVAFVFNVAHEKLHQNYAYEAFLPTGPCASLPMVHPYHSSIIWTVPTRDAQTYQALDTTAFNTLINATYPTLGTLEILTPVWTYPLSGLLVTKPYKERVLLIGDAAHAMHPVAGQGLNVGIGDVIALGRLMHHTKKLGLDIGGRKLFDDFVKERRFDVQAMTLATDSLVRLFSNHSITLNFFRDQGLKLVQKSSVLKRFFTQKAMGKI